MKIATSRLIYLACLTIAITTLYFALMMLFVSEAGAIERRQVVSEPVTAAKVNRLTSQLVFDINQQLQGVDRIVYANVDAYTKIAIGNMMCLMDTVYRDTSGQAHSGVYDTLYLPEKFGSSAILPMVSDDLFGTSALARWGEWTDSSFVIYTYRDIPYVIYYVLGLRPDTTTLTNLN